MNASSAYPGTEGPDAAGLPFPRPTAFGSAFFFAAAAAMAFGILRNELAAILWSTIVLAALAYAYVAIFLSLILRRKDIRGYLCRIIPRECKEGESINLQVKGTTRFRLPLILVRYGIRLSTADGRETEISFDSDRRESIDFPAGGRGAYGSVADTLRIFDAFGFFRASFSIPAESGPRLIVRPAPAEESPDAPITAGGSERRTERVFRRTEDLTDNRRYAPGDDPRRINWKLYGHAGELFVRDGEPEPPPRSRFVVLVDSSVDYRLFDASAARRAVDALAEQALGLINTILASGYEPRFGYNGSGILSGDARDAAGAFAFPAAVDARTAGDLPLPEQSDGGSVVFALPRKRDFQSALDRFIRASSHSAGVHLFFIAPETRTVEKRPLYRQLLFRAKMDAASSRAISRSFSPRDLELAAADCVAAYGQKGGVHAGSREA